jgi:hypothetical protein
MVALFCFDCVGCWGVVPEFEYVAAISAADPDDTAPSELSCGIWYSFARLPDEPCIVRCVCYFAPALAC